ncbi:MAG: signal peptidase I [Candidatus Velthaea sp.]
MNTTTMAIGVAAFAAISLITRFLMSRTKGQPSLVLEIVNDYAGSFFAAGLAALVIVTFIARPFWIPSESMVPTLKISDVLIVDELRYRLTGPGVGDIAVFHPPIATTDDFIKRVVAAPGDSLRIDNGRVYRDGRLLDEPYAEQPFYNLEVRDYGIVVDGQRLNPEVANIPARAAWSAPDRLPANCYIMLGDNRNNSLDSHVWGCAQRTGTFVSGPRRGAPAGFVGRAEVAVWPLRRIRLLAGETAIATPLH